MKSNTFSLSVDDIIDVMYSMDAKDRYKSPIAQIYDLVKDCPKDDVTVDVTVSLPG
jgi:hypothetical protein